MSITKTPPISIYPVWNTEQEPGTQRYSTMVTPQELRDRSLFGIPLKSTLTGQELSDATLQQYINEAISEIEHALDLYITPVKFEEKHDYIRHQFTWHYNYTKLNHPNVINIEKVQINFTNSPEGFAAIDFPLEFVALHPTEGVFQLVPAFGTSFSGFLLSAMSGTQFYVLQQAVMSGKFPDSIRVTYTSGFEKDKIPAVMVALTEVTAAYRLLSILGPILFPYNSVSVSIDGTSQGTSTLGPAFFRQRLDELEKQKNQLMDAAKGYYQRKFLVDWL